MKQYGCSACPHRKDCPDAYTVVSQYCGNYLHKEDEEAGK